MTIPHNKLADLVLLSKHGAIPGEKDRLEILIETIHNAKIRAEIGSPESIFLKQVVEAHRNFLTDKAIDLLDKVDIYGVDLPVINAIPQFHDGHRQIVMFSGLLHVVFFYAALINVATYLKLDQPDYKISINDEEHSGALQFLSAGMVLIIDYIKTGQNLVDITCILTDQVRSNVVNGYVGAVLFIVLHELGHLELGHLTDRTMYSERPHSNLAYNQSLNKYQQAEFDADLFAIGCIKEVHREIFTPSIAFFLGSFMFLESFIKENWTHPYSVNRLKRIVEVAGMEPDAKLIMDAFIDERVAGLHHQARQGTARAYAFEKIFDNMPPSVARRVVDIVVNDVHRYQSKLGINYVSTYTKRSR